MVDGWPLLLTNDPLPALGDSSQARLSVLLSEANSLLLGTSNSECERLIPLLEDFVRQAKIGRGDNEVSVEGSFVEMELQERKREREPPIVAEEEATKRGSGHAGEAAIEWDFETV